MTRYNLLALTLLVGGSFAFTAVPLQPKSHHSFALQTSTLDGTDIKINDKTTSQQSFRDRLASSSAASAAAVATAAVSAAVSMKSLEAPDVTKSYIALDVNNTGALDDEGLPLVYDKELIQQYWSKERGALNRRWGYFVSKAVPFFSKMVTLFIRDGKITDEEIPALSKQAREDLEDLGATFIKAGQMMSVRPDVLPQVRAVV